MCRKLCKSQSQEGVKGRGNEASTVMRPCRILRSQKTAGSDELLRTYDWAVYVGTLRVHYP